MESTGVFTDKDKAAAHLKVCPSKFNESHGYLLCGSFNDVLLNTCFVYVIT